MKLIAFHLLSLLIYFLAGCQSAIKVTRASRRTEVRTAAARIPLILDDCRETHKKR